MFRFRNVSIGSVSNRYQTFHRGGPGRQLFLVPVSPQGQPADVRKARNRPGLLAHGGGWAHFSWLTWLARRRRARARLERREVCGLVG